MKYLITESKLEEYIIHRLDEMFPEHEIHYMSPYEYDEEIGVEGEDECRLLFYLGDYEEDEYIFKWYDKCYWNPDTWQGERQIERSPVVDIEEPYKSELYNMFNDLWIEPFKKWFESRIEIPIKSVNI